MSSSRGAFSLPYVVLSVAALAVATFATLLSGRFLTAEFDGPPQWVAYPVKGSYCTEGCAQSNLSCLENGCSGFVDSQGEYRYGGTIIKTQTPPAMTRTFHGGCGSPLLWQDQEYRGAFCCCGVNEDQKRSSSSSSSPPDDEWHGCTDPYQCSTLHLVSGECFDIPRPDFPGHYEYDGNACGDATCVGVCRMYVADTVSSSSSSSFSSSRSSSRSSSSSSSSSRSSSRSSSSPASSSSSRFSSAASLPSLEEMVWIPMDPGFGTSKNVQSVIYGNGMFVAVGAKGRGAYSADGIDWTAIGDMKLGTFNNIPDIAYGGGKFVAIGGKTYGTYSTDGVHWNVTGDMTFGTNSISSIIYGNGMFVAVGQAGKGAISTNGTDWTAISDMKVGKNNLTSVTFGANKFVAAYYGGKGAISTNGTDWTAISDMKTGKYASCSVTFANGKFFAMDQYGKGAYSADGIDWTAIGDMKVGGNFLTSIAYGNGKFVAVATKGKGSYSANGADWTAFDDMAFGTDQILSVAYGADKFVAVGGSGKGAYTGIPPPPASSSVSSQAGTPASSSSQAGTPASSSSQAGTPASSSSQAGTPASSSSSSLPPPWPAITMRFGTYEIYAVAYGGGKYVAVGDHGLGAYSINGIDWTTIGNMQFGTDRIRSVTYGSGMFLAVGDDGKGAYSTYGVSWTPVGDMKFGSTIIRSVAYGGGRYVAVGDDGKSAYSTNGTSWTGKGDMGFSGGPVFGVAYGNGKFLAVGQYGKAFYSTNGSTWTGTLNIGFGVSDANAVTFGGGRFLVAGNHGKAALSDGTDVFSWSTVPSTTFGITDNIRAVAYGNGSYVLGGDYGWAALSADGAAWEVTNPGFGPHAVDTLAYGAGRFVAAGGNGNGSTLQTSSAASSSSVSGPRNWVRTYPSTPRGAACTDRCLERSGTCVEDGCSDFMAPNGKTYTGGHRQDTTEGYHYHDSCTLTMGSDEDEHYCCCAGVAVSSSSSVALEPAAWLQVGPPHISSNYCDVECTSRAAVCMENGCPSFTDRYGDTYRGGEKGIYGGQSNQQVSHGDCYSMWTNQSSFQNFCCCAYRVAVCGNGTTEHAEECDDGANNGTVCLAPYGQTCSYCTATCMVATAQGTRCGDGVVQSDQNEQCDDGTDNGKVCTDYWYGNPCTYCSATCATATKWGPRCGDGTLQADWGEQCDKGTANSDSPLLPPLSSYNGICRTSCKPASCGDGIKDNWEQCDAGSLNGTDPGNCTADCKLICGNGEIQLGERCDDHNLTNGDGCSAQCAVESGWACMNQCTASAGSSVASVGVPGSIRGFFESLLASLFPRYFVAETKTLCWSRCSKPGAGSGSWVTVGPPHNSGGTCAAECGGRGGTCMENGCAAFTATDNQTYTGGRRYGGDRFGFSSFNDMTHSSCTEPWGGAMSSNVQNHCCCSPETSVCGDNVVEEGEQCEMPNYPCVKEGTSCSPACLCPAPPFCGDGRIELGREACDSGGYNGIPCTATGYLKTCTYCNATCTATVTVQGPRCGDGIVQGPGPDTSGEECDDGNLIDTDTCTNSCRRSFCGDGIKQTNEECDNGVNNSASCYPSPGQPCTYCSSRTCRNITIQDTCGNGITNILPDIVIPLPDGTVVRATPPESETCDDGKTCGVPMTCEKNSDCAGKGDGLCIERGGFAGKRCDAPLTCERDSDCAGKGGDGLCLARSGDGCDTDCHMEQNWSCSGAPSQCWKHCGNGIIEPMLPTPAEGEQCDNGVLNGLPNNPCSAACRLRPVSRNWRGATVRDFQTCSVICERRGGWCVEEGCDATTGGTRVRTASGSQLLMCESDVQRTAGTEVSCCCESMEDVCGDGLVGWTEGCDDGNTSDEDGCSRLCRVEPGWACAGMRSACEARCGNGKLDDGETCEDGNRADGDGCSAACTAESGWKCDTLIPCSKESDCAGIGDGHCKPRYGRRVCEANLPICVNLCGNGMIDPGESCDAGLRCADGSRCWGSEVCPADEDVVLADNTCSLRNYPVEGMWCTGNGRPCRNSGDCPDYTVRNPRTGQQILHTSDCVPSFSPADVPPAEWCTATCDFWPTCGNGIRENREGCDDGNIAGYDGCSPGCRVETGWRCTDDAGRKSACSLRCGNGIQEEGELCDDGNRFNGDGCTRTCLNLVVPCGDGTVGEGEECDDGNRVDGDGCSASCEGTSWKRASYDFPFTCNEACRSYGMACTDARDSCPAIYGKFDVLDVLTSGGVLGTVDHPESHRGETFNTEEGRTWSQGTCDTLFGMASEADYKCCCTPRPACGDGTVDPGEECDDGNHADKDGCSAACSIENGWRCNRWPLSALPLTPRSPSSSPGSYCTPMCGDGIVTGTEQCDDGNTKDGDGCSGACAVETGWECKDSSSACTRIPCVDGDAVLDTLTLEGRCLAGVSYMGDRGATRPGGTHTTGMNPCLSQRECLQVTSCYSDIVVGERCSLVSSPDPTCSPFLIPPYGEPIPLPDNWSATLVQECNDGNWINDDGCTNTCKEVQTACGNGIREEGEECDDDPAGSAACRPDCTRIRCGDGIADAGEECDDGNRVNDDGCTVTCRSIRTECGNYRLEQDEKCDDGNLRDGDGCSHACAVEKGWTCLPYSEYSVCTHTCGNGVRDPGESCDDGVFNGRMNGCRPDCSPSVLCGDGSVNTIAGGEECDDGNLFNDDLCTRTCKNILVRCGNGEQEEGETCDDGNIHNFDGCSDRCELEEGDDWVCTGTQPTVCQRPGSPPRSSSQPMSTAWTATDMRFGGSSIKSIAHGAGKFVAVGENGKGSHSTDGITWTAITDMAFGLETIHSIIYGDGRFVAVGAHGKGAYSADGITWTAITDMAFGTGTFMSIAYGNGTFVAAGDGGLGVYSTNGGATWMATNDMRFDGRIIYSLTYAAGRFVAVGDKDKGAVSFDGITWEATDDMKFGAAFPVYSVTYGAGKFLAVGIGRGSYSADGITWTEIDDDLKFGRSYPVISVTYGAGRFVAVGFSGRGSYSAGSAAWLRIADMKFGTDTIRSVAYGAGRFVAVGNHGKGSYSETFPFSASSSISSSGSSRSSSSSHSSTAPLFILMFFRTSAPVTAGGMVRYDAQVTNANATAGSVTLTLPIPAGLAFLPPGGSSPTAADCAQQGSQVVCTLQNLPAGYDQKTAVAFTLSSAFCGVLRTQAFLTVGTGTPQTPSVVVDGVPCCGNGKSDDGEACDDGNMTTGDGCSTACAVETGWSCRSSCSASARGFVGSFLATLFPSFFAADTTSACRSVCTPICGDGVLLGNEQCDDGNSTAGDGCTAACVPETGWVCGGSPSTCHTVCGDGVMTGTEQCDDGNMTAGDGCTAACAKEPTFSLAFSRIAPATAAPGGPLRYAARVTNTNAMAAGSVSVTLPIPTGLTFVPSGGTSPTSAGCVKQGSQILCKKQNPPAGFESEYVIGFTLSSSFCGSLTAQASLTVDTGSPQPAPAVTDTVSCCGNGQKNAGEQCDDRNTAAGDGCSAACALEAGWTCNGAPSLCRTACGDRIVAGVEQCDDGNRINWDGCSASCTREPLFDFLFSRITPVITPGGVLQYIANARNTNATAASSVIVTLPIPPGLIFLPPGGTSPTSAGCVQRGSVIFCGPQAFSAGLSRDYVIGFSVPASLCGTITAKAGLSRNGSTQQLAPILTDILGCCGNRVVNAGEQCDDGNKVNGDGCSAACLRETSAPRSSARSSARSSSSVRSSSARSSSARSSSVRSSSVSSSPFSVTLRRSSPTTITLRSGTTVQYVARIRNAGKVTMQNASLTFPIPRGLQFSKYLSNNRCALTGTLVRCSPLSLTPNSSGDFAVAFQIPSSFCGPVSPQATLTLTSGQTFQSPALVEEVPCR